MDKKLRVSIPEDIAAEILYLSDRTCCFCNCRGKQVQIDYIDENPANKDISNLFAICFDCHELTMSKSDFGRRLETNLVIKNRNQWLDRVKARKDKAHEIASIRTITGSTETIIETEAFEEDFLDYKTCDDPKLLNEYLDKILIVEEAQLTLAQEKWDTGITAVMNQGNYDMIDFYEAVLIELSKFYPKGHFDNLDPKKYFNEIISSKFMWNRFILEPQGIETGGVMVSTIKGGNVMDDLKRMVDDMVKSLSSSCDFEFLIDIQKLKEILKK